MLMALAAAAAFGAAYPGATLDGPMEQGPCLTRYRFTTADPLARVAAFYRAEANAAGVPVLGDTQARFPDYETLIFAQQPRFLDVVLSRADGRTVAQVGYHVTVPPGCARS